MGSHSRIVYKIQLDVDLRLFVCLFVCFFVVCLKSQKHSYSKCLIDGVYGLMISVHHIVLYFLL